MPAWMTWFNMSATVVEERVSYSPLNYDYSSPYPLLHVSLSEASRCHLAQPASAQWLGQQLQRRLPITLESPFADASQNGGALTTCVKSALRTREVEKAREAHGLIN